jgi:hypothetical protein
LVDVMKTLGKYWFAIVEQPEENSVWGTLAKFFKYFVLFLNNLSLNLKDRVYLV